jgi:tetratricopeptide (TPR) repeat protein
MGDLLPSNEHNLGKEYFCAGVGKFLDGRYEEAEVEFKEALKCDPEFPLAYCYLGIISLELGQVDLGMNWCERGLEIDPANGYLHYCLGAAFERKGMAKEAIKQYKIYLKEHPKDSECYFSLGCAYDENGQIKEAVKCYREAIHLDSSHYKAYYNLSLLLGERGSADEAIECLDKTIEINPTYWKGWIKLGFFLSGQKKWAEAVIAYERAIDLRPDIADSHYNIGLCFLSLGKAKKAVKSFEDAHRLNASDPETTFYMALAQLDLKEEELAIDALMKTFAIDLSHERAHYLLGRLYYLRGEDEKGDKELHFLENLQSSYAKTLKANGNKSNRELALIPAKKRKKKG